jgi:hypothetical protein
LEELRAKGCTVFHDIVSDNFNIDHVIVSPQGVFAVETKTYKIGRGGNHIKFDGQKITIQGSKPDDKPIQQAILNSKRISEILDESSGKLFPVRPIVLFPGWFIENPDYNERVWVTNPKMLQWEIPKQPVKLTKEDVHLAAFHLSRLIKL